MPSIIPGYQYDIFISYRKKDNKYDGWVTEFVSNLRKELEATFKEEITIYFDENPSDGILETYDVDKSLEGKLKCVIFIPVISRTYCDLKSFAWHNEFIAFNNFAKADVIGRELLLQNGNVASRILPVKIHDLDPEDKALLENELGGSIRSIDFIYKSHGVNRPLEPADLKSENLNHTFYRDQINKVAITLKEIINGISYSKSESNKTSAKNTVTRRSHLILRNKMLIPRVATWVFVFLGLSLSIYVLSLVLSVSSTSNPDKSIAVLPFENVSNNAEQDYFTNGIMQEILNHLFKIGDLKIPSSTSSMRFKGSRLSVREIARELNVSYVLEGYVAQSGDNVRITVRMINGKDERLLWSEDYNKALTATNLLEIQSEVAQQVADKMKVVIDPEVKKRIEDKPTRNTEAYLLYLQATQTGFAQVEYSKQLLEKAINLDPGFADAYATLAYFWLLQGSVYGKLDRDQVLIHAEPLLKKAVILGKNSEFVHTYQGALKLWYYWDFQSVEKEYQIFNKLNPSNPDIRGFFSDYLLASSRYYDAYILTKKVCDNDDINRSAWINMALAYYFSGQQEKAMESVNKIQQDLPNDISGIANSIRLFVYMSKYELAVELFDKNYARKPVNELLSCYLGHMGIAYFKTGKTNYSDIFLKELNSRSEISPVGSPSFFAAEIYTARGEKYLAFKSLEKAYRNHEVELYWLNVEPIFKPLHGDPQFENILKKIGFK